MPLRDVSEYHAWIGRESPSLSARSVTRTLIAELGDQPWRAPSVPIAELSSQPQYEVRTAALEVKGEQDVRNLVGGRLRDRRRRPHRHY